MKHGIKTKIAQATDKSVSFICQYFKGLKNMSWETANKASKVFPFIEPELWMNRNIQKIEKRFSSEYNHLTTQNKKLLKNISRNFHD